MKKLTILAVILMTLLFVSTVVSAELLMTKGSPSSLSRSIFSMNPDGSEITLIHSGAYISSVPVWSSDKSKILYVSNGSTTGKPEVFLMNADGTNNTQITFNNPQYDANAPIFRSSSKIWYCNDDTPGHSEITEVNYDGSGQIALTNFYAQGKQVNWVNINGSKSKVVYAKQNSSWSPTSEIYIANIDLSGEAQLTSNSELDSYPKFSPDGTRVLFARFEAANGYDNPSNIFVMNIDGSGETKLTNYSASNQSASVPIWSPDGQQIAYTLCDGTQCDIWIMNADGTSPVNITNTPGEEERVSDWKADINPGATRVGYNPAWLIITLLSLTVVGGYILRRKTDRQ